MALGATFSAMEVIPLMLLTLEAWSFIKSGEKQARERYQCTVGLCGSSSRSAYGTFSVPGVRVSHQSAGGELLRNRHCSDG